MPRFYFTVLEPAEPPDLGGTELRDLVAARHEAAKLAGALLRERAAEIARGEELRLAVTDEEGRTVFMLAVKPSKGEE